MGSENKEKTNETVKQERNLSEAEKKRVEAFAVTEEKLKQEGYVRKDLTISIEKANLVGPLLVLPIMAVLIAVFLILYGFEPVREVIKDHSLWTGVSIVLAGLSIIPLAIVHEWIHGLSWGISAEHHMKDIEYGFIKEKLTPYCYCRSPRSKGAYVFGSMMPLTILGVVVSIVAIIIASPVLLLVGLMQVLGGCGDILITGMLLRYKTNGKDVVLLDHPTECGLIVFEKQK